MAGSQDFRSYPMKNLLLSLSFAATTALMASPASATVYYFAECQTGAAAGCVAGNDSNAGTSAAAPWRSISKLQTAFNAGKPGDQFLLAKGGAWTAVAMQLFNSNGGNASAMYANPMIIDGYTASWGSTAKPILTTTTSGANTFDFTRGGAAVANGGYTIRNLSLQGSNVADVGVRLFNGVSRVVLDGLTINGYTSGTTCTELADPATVPSYITIRNSTYTNNKAFAIGMWGCPNITAESNTLDNNGFRSPMMDHPVYISGSSQGRTVTNVVIRNNRLTNNSLTSGMCQSTIIVAHDLASDWTIEGNYIYQAPGTSGPGCWGIAVSPGNGGFTEGMDRLAVRGNTIANVGNTAIELASCRSCTVENNVLVWEKATNADGIRFHAPVTSPALVGTALSVRNNSIYFASGSTDSRGVVVNDQGTGHVIVSNLVDYAGGTNLSCFDTNLSNGSFSGWNNNLCFNAGWTPKYSTRAAFTSATGFDANSLSTDPKLAAVPSLSNAFSMALTAASPAINAGSTLLSSTIDKLLGSRNAPDIGAFEYNAGTTDLVAPSPPQSVTVR